MRKIQNISAFQLELILESTPGKPYSINESVFENELRDNTKLKWRMNPYLARREKLRLMIDADDVYKWVLLGKSIKLVLLFIITYSVFGNDNKILWMLLIPIILLPSGILDHWIMMLNLAGLLVLKSYIGFNGHYFWIAFSLIFVTYLLSKITQEFAEKKVLKIAFSDSITFWKYYSNRLIYVDGTGWNREFQRLADKYPVLGD